MVSYERFDAQRRVELLVDNPDLGVALHGQPGGLRELTRQHGAILIFDEVITGFRHALGGYQQICGVMPDLTTFGKGMANGIPVGGLAGRRDLMEHFNGQTGNVLLAGTFNGNPIACAAAMATIDSLSLHPDFYERTYALGARMRNGLTEIVKDLSISATVAGFGGVFASKSPHPLVVVSSRSLKPWTVTVSVSSQSPLRPGSSIEVCEGPNDHHCRLSGRWFLP